MKKPLQSKRATYSEVANYNRGNTLKVKQRLVVCFLLILICTVSAAEEAIITCQSKDCATISAYKNIQFKPQKGIDVFISPLFDFTMSNGIVKLMKLHKSIVLEGVKKNILIVSDVELSDFGLDENDGITLSEFFRYTYLKKYSRLNSDNISVNALLAIKAHKLSIALSSKTNTFHFTVKNIDFYAYNDPESQVYEIHAISNSNIKFGQSLSLVGASQQDFENIVSSIRIK